MGILLFLLGLGGSIGSLVFLIINVLKKQPKKTPLVGLGLCFVLLITGFILIPTGTDEFTIDANKDYIQEEASIDTEETEEVKVEKEETKETKDDSINKPIEVSRKSELEISIRSRVNDGDYTNVKLDKITINENLGSEEEDYITLVYFVFDVKNTRDTGNKVMKMYSDDLVATLANKGITDVSEIAIFWEDEYNNRSLKYAYEYRDGGFYIMDIAGE